MKKLMILGLISVLILGGCDAFQSELGVNVKGTIRNNGASVSGAITILLNSKDALNNISSLNVSDLSSLTSIVKGVSTSDASGNYTISFVKEGIYTLVAIRDVNANNTLDTLDEIGWYGRDTTIIIENDTFQYAIPDTFYVNGNTERSGININYFITKKLYDSTNVK